MSGKPLLSLSKRYYTAEEVAQHVGVPVHVLRFWEQEFAPYLARRAGRRRRYYRHEELLVLRRIARMLLEEGASLGEVHRVQALALGLADRFEVWRRELVALRALLEEADIAKQSD